MVKTCCYLREGEPLSFAVDDNLVWAILDLLLDEAKEVLLVHAGGCVNVGVHLGVRGAGPREGERRERSVTACRAASTAAFESYDRRYIFTWLVAVRHTHIPS